MKSKLQNRIVQFLVIVLFLSSQLTASFAAAPSNGKNSNHAQLLLEGKNSLDNGNYEQAISLLSSAGEKLPLLSDYALMWRAQAYEGKGDIDNALADLKALKSRHKESLLIKSARTKEIELLRKKNERGISSLFESFINDYPSDYSAKYEYASHLKGSKETEKSKKIFKELFVSASSFSKNAAKELSPSDITPEDLIKRGKNLNNAWFFEDAEKCFREALKNINGSMDGLRVQALEGLAYSVFRQKRYREASDLYKGANNNYWRARSVLRAGDLKTFESELEEFTKTPDKRNAPVLIAYGTKKRRQGDIEAALRTFKKIPSQYSSSKEEALWATGWTYYISKDYKSAHEVFSQLYSSYGDPKYLYWKCRCSDYSGDIKPSKASFNANGTQRNSFYAFLSFLKNGQKPPAVEKQSLTTALNSPVSERVEILTMLGMKQEAINELIHISKKNPGHNELVYASVYLKKLGNYKMSINYISKLTFSEELHDLFYPLGYWAAVEEAAKKNNMDPFLILSVIREESRFDSEARSIAGAIGLMQLMPQTAQRFKKHLKHSGNLTDAETNIIIGSYYLKHLLKTFNSIPVALAAYNAGEDAVKDWLKNDYNKIDEFIEDIPYTETQNYVKRVMTTYFEYLRASGTADISEAKKYIGNL